MKKKIFKYYLLLIFLALLATIFFTTQIAQKYYKDEVANKLKGIGFSIEYYLLEASSTREELDYDALARDFASKYNTNNQLDAAGLRITFVDFAGKVLGDSEVDYRRMDNHLNRNEIQKAIQGHIGSDIRISTTLNSDMLYVAMPLNELQVIVRVSVPLTQLHQINDSIRSYSLVTFFVALILAVIISFRIADSIIKPLNDLILASKEIANGNYKKKITVQTHDELGQLSSNFNEMAAKLDVTITDLNRKKVEVESIVDSMNVGLIAVDNGNKIILLNPAASDFFGIENSFVIGDRLVEHIRNNQINTLLIETINNNKPLAADVVMNERVLQINTSPIKAKDTTNVNSGGLVFIQDITKMRKLEQLRTEFVSNVTHELKTPITSIKGFIETLKNGALTNEKVAVKFLDIIDIEAERLHDLINDILQLSEIETKQKDTNLESFSLRGLIDEVFAVVLNMANEKNISLHNQVNGELMINANKNRMKQLFMNLVDNGIKYNIPQGSVTIAAYRDIGRLVISVKDTGIGIPAEHRARIFERFYRVDKGRTRDMGGTGLGLSIVKHIVNLYNGDIKVRSELDKGTEFIIQIPS